MIEIIDGIIYIILYLLALIMLGTMGLGIITLFIGSGFTSLNDKEAKIASLKLISVPFLFVVICSYLNPEWDSGIVLNTQRLAVLILLLREAWPKNEWPLDYANKVSG